MSADNVKCATPEPINARDVGKNLARTMILLRELKGISMREHAKFLNISPATLCRIESGKVCDIATLAAIRNATGIKYHVLLGEKP